MGRCITTDLLKLALMEDWGDRKCRSFTTEIVKLKLVFILAPEPGRKMVWLMKDTAWLLVTLGSFPKFTWVTNGRCPTLPRFNHVYHPKVFLSIICCSLDNTKQNILERTEIIGNTYGEKYGNMETGPELQVLGHQYFISECVRNRGMDPARTVCTRERYRIFLCPVWVCFP